ncbi:MAG: helix-hairpin-helix domain-containing protein [Deltaproteobacteria bacterium]|jgi:competence protein ComEA|nr:helix-hairpin-helix domain-containing protein [Deltaproteobacteria bacterium]
MEQRQALAGFALSAALFALAVPVTSSESEDCLDPTESAAVAQHTTAVRCETAQVRAAEIRGPARRLFGLPIELNCAGARTFESLDRIGSVRARQIVEERARAPFERVDDLLRVRGIGPKTLEELRPVLAANPRAPQPGSVDSPQCRAEAVRSFRLGAGGRM